MTQTIHKKIDEISSEVSLTKNRIASLSSENDRLQNELLQSEQGLTKLKDALNIGESKIKELEKVIALKSEQNSSIVPLENNRDNEIDELVKEIEYCIGQLRK
ncbi:MAG: chromosome segregation ATPase [Lentimonas sp.]|jgi:chromosome segregation ATPase